MKHVLIVLAVLLTGCGPYPEQTVASNTTSSVRPDKEGCIIDTSSKLVTQHNVGPITNLVKEKEYWGHKGECTVRFDITVNGETYHLEETEEGMEQLESLCYYARERARRNLLLDLGGKFNSQATVACTHRDKS
jgi:hypothetical protein